MPFPSATPTSSTHPFPLLLRLEWMLLGIALVAVLSPLPLTGQGRPWRSLGAWRNPSRLPPDFMPRELPRELPGGWGHPLGDPRPVLPPEYFFVLVLGAIACIVLLGYLGQRLPRDRTQRLAHTALGFGLSWLVILLVGRGETVLPPLLLVVVMRGCLLFEDRTRRGQIPKGRLLIAALAHGSFLLMQVLGFLQIRPLGIPLTHLPFPRRRLPEDLLTWLWIQQTLNSAILFGLVLAFVLLLVGALLAEQESRRQLIQAHERLRGYALRVEDQATLQERNRIAREMHDSVGHALTAQSIQLENVALKLQTDPDRAAHHLQQAREMGKEAMKNVRQTVATLRQGPLQNQPLETALQQLLTDFTAHTQAPIQAQITSVSPLPTDVAIALYRITQEALTNITKHAQAQRIQVQLERQGMQIQLAIADNGRGFDLGQNTTGFGLQSMRDRAEALGGHLHIQTAPGQGCQIHVVMPI